MNSLWQPIARVSCTNTRTIFQSCTKADSLIARLAQGHARSISNVPAIFLLGNSRWQRKGEPNIMSMRLPSRIMSRIEVRTFISKRILTRYEELPANFDEQGGLEFQLKPLSLHQVNLIFGKGVIDVSTATRLLRILHGQRVAGTLEEHDRNGFPSRVAEKARIAGLAWLRNNVSVDEVQNAALRAEQELREMGEDIIADSERIGLYQPNSGGDKEGPYGRSVIEQIRKSNEKAFEEEQERKKVQAEEIRQNSGTLEVQRPRSDVVLRTPRGQNERLQYYIDRAKGPSGPIPEMTALARLWPSALFCLATVFACYVLTQVYTPPKNSSRLWPDIPPSAATVIGIICLNAIVLAMWRMPPLFRFLNKNFIMVPAYPNPFSLLANTFSHQTLTHFGLNMLVLWLMGTRLHEEVGRANFLAIYLSCGVVSSFGSLVWFVARRSFVSSSLGASGAIAGVIGTYLSLNAESKITVFGLPPPGWPSISSMTLLIILMGLEGLGMLRISRGLPGMSDHTAHLGGFICGIGSTGILRYRYKQRKVLEEERRKKLGFVDKIKEGRRPF